jgi:3-deoxy-7-phosphoheptulonate synthase
MTDKLMNVRVIKKMPSADDIIAATPISDKDLARVAKDRQEISDILAGRDDRLLCIVGPCSAWPSEAVLEYAKRLKKVSDKIKKSVKVVMRIYIQKPRTIRGWLGPVNQPNPFESPDIAVGAQYCRNMMVKVIEMGLPVADEALFTHNARGFAELLSWIAIGARSVEDQEHRIFASGLHCPVGMKNATSGSIEIAVNGIVAAQHKHHAVFDGHQVETLGNHYAHLVLRGGSAGPNYGPEHVHEAALQFQKHKVKNPAIIIDVSHDNCKVNGSKATLRQIEVMRECLALRGVSNEYRTLVKGFMIESFIKDGAQKLESLDEKTIARNGLSITDPCVGWDATEAALKEMAEAV